MYHILLSIILMTYYANRVYRLSFFSFYKKIYHVEVPIYIYYHARSKVYYNTFKCNYRSQEYHYKIEYRLLNVCSSTLKSRLIVTLYA